jgi:hypothetical protein
MPTQSGKTLFSQHYLETRLPPRRARRAHCRDRAHGDAAQRPRLRPVRPVAGGDRDHRGEHKVPVWGGMSEDRAEGFVLALRPKIMYTQVRVVGLE